jgi:ribosomal-protein-alanine N-acetyltransferase
MSTVTLVPMTTAHIAAVMPFEREMFGTEAWSASGYRAEVTDTRNRYYVAAEDADGALVGWAGVLIIGEAAEILTVGVVPSARRRGIGRALLADLLSAAIERGATEAYLEVRIDNLAARELYATAGFDEVGVRRGYYAGGRVDGVTMKKLLAT